MSTRARYGFRSLLRLKVFIDPFKLRYALFLGLSCPADFVHSYLFARILGRIVSHASAGEVRETAWSVGWLVALMLASALLLPLLRYGWQTTTNAIDSHMRSAVFAHVRRLPLSYFDDVHSGDTLARLTSDMAQARGAYDRTLANFLSMMVGGVGGLIVTGSIHWIIMLSAIAIGGTNALVNFFYIPPLRKIATEKQSASSDATQAFVDILHGIDVVKVFGLGKWAAAHHERGNARLQAAEIRRANVAGAQLFSVDILRWLSIGGILVIACILGSRGEVTVEQIMVAGTMGGEVAMMLSYFSQTLGDLQGSIAGAERVLELMDHPAETMLHSGSPRPARPVAAEEGSAVSIRDLSFSYGGPPVLDGVTVTVPKGKTLAVVGKSGSGKSTLCKILMGLYQPGGGAITILGKAYDAYSLEELRATTAYVPQCSYLFNGTVWDNITWGAKQASEAQVEEVAKAAQAHGFITELPEGYRTVVGERGVKLSGGQRQRVAIARALLKNAPILLLDEATSSLDTESELLVQKALEALMEGRTTLVIAHRLATVERADSIIVLEEGKVIEQGTHHGLLEREGRYAFYYRGQFSGAGA